jgi:hypothetical protein
VQNQALEAMVAALSPQVGTDRILPGRPRAGINVHLVASWSNIPVPTFHPYSPIQPHDLEDDF